MHNVKAFLHGVFYELLYKLEPYYGSYMITILHGFQFSAKFFEFFHEIKFVSA